MRGFFRSDRGQALYETAISLPLFILAMYGLFWSIRMATIGERLQIGTRYGGLVSSLSNPYLSYSLYNLYATIDGVAPNTAAACGIPAQTAALGGRKGFFTAVQPVPVPTCASSFTQFNGPETYTEPIFWQSEYVSLTAAVPVHGLGFFSSTAPPSTVASQNFFRAPDVGAPVACSALSDPVKKSLEPQTDTAPPTSPATSFPQTIPTDSASSQSCVAFGPPPPAPSGPPPTVPPTATPTATPTNSPSPKPTASPTHTPSPVPTQSPTPSPVPSASPTPKPTAIPTATPTPSPTPTASPKPTATPVPTATPIPTATPVPTAVPTSTPIPTATPKPTATPVPTPTASPSPVPTPTPSPRPSPTPSPTPNINGTPPGGSNS